MISDISFAERVYLYLVLKREGSIGWSSNKCQRLSKNSPAKRTQSWTKKKVAVSILELTGSHMNHVSELFSTTVLKTNKQTRIIEGNSNSSFLRAISRSYGRKPTKTLNTASCSFEFTIINSHYLNYLALCDQNKILWKRLEYFYSTDWKRNTEDASDHSSDGSDIACLICMYYISPSRLLLGDIIPLSHPVGTSFRIT